MMYGLERRRITVYKYLKGNIKEGERLFTALERSLTEQKLASRSRGKLGRIENTKLNKGDETMKCNYPISLCCPGQNGRNK